MSKFKKGLELIKNYDIKRTDNGIKIIDNRTNLELADEPQNEQIFAENKKLRTIVEYTIFKKNISALNQMLENEDFTFLDEQYDKLEQSILQTFRTGGTVVPNDEYQCHDIGEYFLKRIGGLDLYNISLDTNRREEVIHAKKLINYILNRNGLKLTDLKTEFQGKYKPEKISWSTEKLSLKENLNPNNPQYTQSNKTKKLSPKGEAKRRAFAEELIAYYKMRESDSAYADRVENEEANMKAVADVVNMSKSIDRVASGKGLMNRLMAAQNLSLNGEKDYFEYIISQPAVTDALLEIKKSGRFEQIKQEAEENKANGKIRDGRVKGHYETIGERCTRLANNAISRNPTTVNGIKRYLSSNQQVNFNKEDETTAYVFSAVARTMGNTPTIKNNSDGSLTFDSGTAITK